MEATRINVMNNFMLCNNMIFGELQKFCITYKQNQANFEKFSRKQDHDFRVRVNDSDYENATGYSVKNEIGFLVSKPNG